MRNLNPDEIYDQVVEIDKQSQLYYNRPLTNIVFMGMGEPLMNYKNTLTAIEKITSNDGLGMSPKRITVSTSGITKIIREISDQNPRFKLAVSLHSAIEETRNRLMPFTKTFPLDQLLEALKYWYKKTKSQVTFEVVVWKDINDKQVDIDALVGYCKQVPSKVNLIEYNAIEDDQFVQARPEAISAYTTALENNRISVTVRRSRGKDIDAACGQLANKNNEFTQGQDV
jgi:23S rRNA (adenine2503-C2)-methyltransferase